MDKLEPVIRHRFWIIFGLTLPIALFAYYSSSGKMAEATTSQESRLESTLSGVPSGDADPNETYAAGAKVINDDLAARFQVKVQDLWEMQTERMTWPKVVVPYVPDTYRGDIDSKARYTYARIYKGVIQNLWERVEPYVGDVKSNPAIADIDVNWDQKVIIDGHGIPHASFNLATPPVNKDIWDAQEDIWLLELIFDAVVRLNEEASFVTDAPLRQIDKIELVGGSGESSVAGSGAAGSMMGDYGDDYGGAEYENYGAMSAMGGMMQGEGGGLGKPAAIGFNVAEEFGPQVPEESDATASASLSSESGDYGEDYGTEYGMFGAGFGSGTGVNMQRYIGPAGMDAFEESYRERGFYMSVIILQDSIPDFFAELSSSPWPIRIGRFHIGANPYAPKTSTGGYGGPSGFAMGFGGYGGSSEGMYGAGDNFDSDYGSYGQSGMSFGYGFGGMGAGASQLKLPDYMKMPTNLDPSLRASPDLVQLDFCGIITMYNPVTDDSVEAVDDGSTAEDFAEALETTAETPEEALQMQQEEAAAAAANADAGNAGPADPTATPADGAAPPAEAASPDPPSAPPAATAPPATETSPAAESPDAAAEAPPAAEVNSPTE